MVELTLTNNGIEKTEKFRHTKVYQVKASSLGHSVYSFYEDAFCSQINFILHSSAPIYTTQ
jgi:hypothetical protein